MVSVIFPKYPFKTASGSQVFQSGCTHNEFSSVKIYTVGVHCISVDIHWHYPTLCSGILSCTVGLTWTHKVHIKICKYWGLKWQNVKYLNPPQNNLQCLVSCVALVLDYYPTKSLSAMYREKYSSKVSFLNDLTERGIWGILWEHIADSISDIQAQFSPYHITCQILHFQRYCIKYSTC